MSARPGDQRIPARMLKQEARGQWEKIFLSIAPESEAAIRSTGKHVPCPVHGNSKDGYRVFKDFKDTGGGICNTCGGHRDGISHLMWLKGWSYPQTLEAIAEVIGFATVRSEEKSTKPRPAPARASASKSDAERREREDTYCREKLSTIWESSVGLSDKQAEPARLYLARRGLGFEYALHTPALRFHPALPYYTHTEDSEKPQLIGDFPAIVAMVFDANGKPCTLHRTYLSEDGRKAPVPMAKKLMPYPSTRSVTGGAIRLMPADKPAVAFTEGLETALAVIEATDGLLPVWPAVSDTLLKNVVPPAHVKSVCLYGDYDRNSAGSKAVMQAKERLWNEGFMVMATIPDVEIPPYAKGVDFLDAFNWHGADIVPFPDSLKEQLVG